MDFANTRLSFSRPLTSYAKVRKLIGAVTRNRYVNRERISGKELLNIGCGPFPLPRFINLDYEWRPGIDLCWDVTKRLPLSDGSVNGVFTEHCLEHIAPESIGTVLREVRRVLVRGGVLRIVVPDGEMYLRTYVEGGRMPLESGVRYFGTYTPMMVVNNVFREHGHLFIYDFDTLRIVLEAAGFADVRRAAFMLGDNPDLLIDSEVRAYGSLYVEAR